MELHPLILSLLILIIVSDTQARSLETPVQCARECTVSENVLFRPDFSYQFSYDANVESSFQTNAEPDSKTSMRIRTTAQVDALSPCEMVLRLSDTTLDATRQPSDEARQAWVASLEQNPLHFSWADGRIPTLCASNDDPVWVLNIKRGILSVMQVSTVQTDTVEETDVTGTCDSRYSVREDGVTKTINKTKIYETCEDRDQHLLFSYFTSYENDSPRQNFIHSSQNCQQEIVRGVLNRVQCAEKHTFRPFSSEESGAQTKITQTLTYTGKTSFFSRQTLNGANSRQIGIKFEKEDGAIRDSQDVREIQNFIDRLCVKMGGENYVEVGKDFVKFIALLRRLDSSAIVQIDSIIDGACPVRTNALRKMFLDALQWCGSESCVVYKAELIAAGPEMVSDDDASRWLHGMSLITKPTRRMLSSIMDVVRSNRMRDTSYLIAGTMIHRLCESTESNCLIRPEVGRALQYFEEKLGTNCHTANENQKQEIVFALRALGNAGRNNAVSTLASCAEESTNDMETRIAAIETFRRMPCNRFDRSSLREMLSDVTQDSEIRIESYLGLMKCPNPSLIQQLVVLLDEEEVQQVASFIWSHLDQVMKSKDPLKGYMKTLLMETEFAKKHDLDPRKYSRYYEASVFSERLNAGATIESSVIWSPKSFVPRSAELGLSVDVFGQAVNLLEVGGRVEGVETLIQSFVGSDGVLKSNPLQFLMSDSSENDNDNDDDDAEEEDEEVEVTEQRSARSTDTQQVDRFQRQYQRKLTTENQPNANWYFRVFGNEMAYGNSKTLKDHKEALTMRSILRQLVQDGSYEYHDNAMIMNSDHILPTGVGLPLNIAFNGSASVDVNVNGEMNVAGLFTKPPSMAINGLFQPRATIVISGTMAVDAHVTKIGIATESSALTSVRMQGDVTLTNGEDLTVQIQAPETRNTIFTFNHKLMKVMGEEMEDIGNSENNVETQCSGIIARQQFCITKPRACDIFPVAGPISMSAYVRKMDRDVTAYRLRGSLVTGNFPTAFSISLIADTPGSSVNDYSASLEYNLERKTFEMAFNGEETSISLNGRMEAEPTRKTVAVVYEKNGVEKRFEGTFEHQRNENEWSWIASSRLVLPSKTISSNVQASIEPYRRLSCNFSIENWYSSPVVANILLNDESKQNSMNYKGRAHLRIPGYVDNGGHFNLKFLPRSNNIKFGLDYQFDNMESQKIVFNHKRQYRSEGDQTSWTADQKFTMTQYPRMNHHIDVKFDNSPENLRSSVKFSYGRHAGQPSNTNKYILFEQAFSYSKRESRKEFDGNFHFAMPEASLRLSADVNHLRSESVFNTSVSVQDYTMRLVLQDDTETNGLMSKRIHVKIPTPWGGLLFNNILTETSPNVYNLTGSFALDSTRGLAMRGTCILENLTRRKRLYVNVGGEGQNLLTAESLLDFSNSETFTFNNSIELKGSNRRTLNLNQAPYQKNQENGISYQVLYDHESKEHFSVFVVRTDNYASGTVRLRNSIGNAGFFSLEGKKIMNDERSNFTLSFATDTEVFSFKKLDFSANYASTPNSFNAGFWYMKDDLRVIGLRMDHSVSNVRRVTINLQQQLAERFPEHIVFVSSIVADRATISVNAEGNEILTAELVIDRDEGSGYVDFNQRIFTQLSSQVRVTITSMSDSIVLRVNYGSNELFAEIPSEIRSPMVLTFRHNDNDLSEYIPRNIQAELSYGIRDSDNGNGVWLASVVNGERTLNSELMLYDGDEKALVFKIDPHVENSLIPAVHAKGYFSRSASNTVVGSFVKFKGEKVTNLYLSWTNRAIDALFDQQLEILPENIPHHVRARASFEGSLTQLDSRVVFELEDRSTDVALQLGLNNQIVSLRANSDLFVAVSDLTLVIAQMQNQFSVNIAEGTASLLDASISSSKSNKQYEFSLEVNQNLDSNIFPDKVELKLTHKPKKFNLKFKYNRYSGIIIADYNINFEQNEGMANLHWQSGGKLKRNQYIPQNIEIGLSLTEAIIGSLNLTLNEQVMRTSVEVNTNEKSINLNLEHNFDLLSDVGIPESVVVSASASYSLNHQDKTIEFEGRVDWNDKNYRVYFYNFLDLENSPKHVNTTLSHNIMEISNLIELPLEMSLNATISDESSSMQFKQSVVFDIARFYPSHHDSENLLELRNNAKMSFGFAPFSGQIILTFLHDFVVPASIPHLMELSCSGSVSRSSMSSFIDHANFNLGLQRDNVKEKAGLSFSLNQHDDMTSTIVFMLTQNFTVLHDYGLPKKLMVKFQTQNHFGNRLDITYDTLKRNIGFDFDYHGKENQVKISPMFFHNFSKLSELGVPKKLGINVLVQLISGRSELKLTTYLNETVKHGHFEIFWNKADKLLTFTYQHHQNISTRLYSKVRITSRSSWFESDIESNVRIYLNNKRKLGVETEVSLLQTKGSVEITQMLTKDFPKRFETAAALLENNILNVYVTKNRKKALEVTVTPTFNRKERSGSISVNLMQKLDYFSELSQNIVLYANGSLGRETTFYLTYSPDFTIDLRAKYNPENKKVSVALNHSQNHWAAVIPKKVKITLHYNTIFSNTNGEVLLNAVADWGSNSKTIDFSTRYTATSWKAPYFSASLNHNFSNYAKFVPLNTNAAVMYEITETGGILQANTTINDRLYTHAIETTFNLQDVEVEATFEIGFNNEPLENLGVPHSMKWSVLANWEQPISTRAYFVWGDDRADFYFGFDETSKAEFNVSHTFSWPIKTCDIVFFLPVETNLRMTAVLNGEEKNINLSGTFNEGRGLIEFEHNFDGLSVKSASVECNYQFGPDYNVAVIATIDGTVYRVEGGFRKLENGFEVTTTLLDTISRIATIQHQMIPGGISLELDHNIPELLEYVPESTAITASVQTTPTINFSTSLRQEQQSRQLSAEVDPIRLRLSVTHQFDSLPIPHSLVVQLSHSPDPLTYQLSVEIDGLQRIASLSFDKSNQRISFTHTIPELDHVFMARDVTVGVKVLPETLGGELYISIDGDERQIGGSANDGVFNIYQTFSSTDVPRNVTLIVKGSLWPLDGAISLTIDEIERFISAQFQPRNLQFDATVEVLEFESYVPRHLSVQVDFDSSSGQLVFSFFKNNKNQTFSAEYSISNRVHVEMSHDIECLSKFPSHLSLDINLNYEEKSAAISLSINQSTQFTLSGDVFVNDNGWYGLTIRGHHYYKKLSKKWKIIREPEITLRGKSSQGSYLGEVTINLIKNHLFESNFEITPIWSNEQKALSAAYSHRYNKFLRRVEGSLQLTCQRNSYDFRVQAMQTAPESQRAEFHSHVSYENDDLTTIRLRTTATNSFDELLKMQVPSNVDSQLSLTYNAPQQLIGFQSFLTFDDSVIRATSDLQVLNTDNKIGFNATAVLTGSFIEKKYNVLSLYKGHEQEVLFQFTVSDPNNNEITRHDELLFSYSVTPRLAMATLHVEQNELNEWGFPETMEVSLETNVNGIDKHWRFNFTIAGMPSSLAVDFVTTESPKTSWSLGMSFDTSASILKRMNIPTHVLVRLAAGFTANMRSFEESFRLEYNKKMLSCSGNQNFGDNSGTSVFQLETTIPKLKKWLKGSEILKTCTYTTSDKEITANGRITIDKAPVGSFNFVINLATKEITFNSLYDENDYHVVFKQIYTESKKQLLFTVSKGGNQLANINLQLFESSANFNVSYDCSESQVWFEMPHHFLMTYTIDLTGSSTYNFEQSYRIESNNEMLQTNTKLHLSKSAGSGGYAYESNVPRLREFFGFSQYEEKFAYTFSNLIYNLVYNLTVDQVQIGDFDLKLNFNDMTINVSANQDSYEARYENVYTDAEKGLHLTVTQNGRSILDVNVQLETNDGIAFTFDFRYHRISYLRKMSIPKVIRVNGEYSSGSITATVIAGKVTLLEISGSFSQLVISAKDFKKNSILSINAQYSMYPKKSITADIVSLPLKQNIHINASLSLFEGETGKSSLNVFTKTNSDVLRVNAFAVPSSTHDAADFLASLKISSSFDVLSSITIQYNSTYDKLASWYNGDFASAVNSKTFTTKVDYRPNSFKLNIAQPWISFAPAVSLSLETKTDSASYKNKILKLQWSENPLDSLSLLGKLRNSGTRFSYAVEFNQPSKLLYITNIDASVEAGLSQSSNYIFNVNTAVNGDRNGMNATYNGILPQLYGNHSLEVDITQSILKAIPSQFSTRGSILLGQSAYNSRWTIHSNGRDLVKLVKTFAKNDDQMTLAVKWEQKWFENAAFSYADINFALDATSGKLTLQIDNIPKISASYETAKRDDNDTITFEVASGPLSRWVKFRKLTWSSWCSKKSATKRKTVILHVNLGIDGRNHQFNLIAKTIGSRDGEVSRLIVTTGFSHPYSLSIFGRPLPKSAEISFKITNRASTKINFAYEDNTMKEPLKVDITYTLQNENTLFDGTVKIDSATIKKLKLAITLFPNSLAVSAISTNQQFLIEGRNTEDTFGVTSVFKDYSGNSLSEWEFSFSFGKVSKIIEVIVDMPSIERTELRGNLPQILNQAKRLLQAALSESRETNLSFVKGINKSESGYDMYVGFEVNRGATYTLHLLVSGSSQGNFAALQTKKNFELQSELARATVKLIEGQLVQIKLAGNSELINFVREAAAELNFEAVRKINLLADETIELLNFLKTIVVENAERRESFNNEIDILISSVNEARSNAINFVRTFASVWTGKLNEVEFATANGVRDALRALLSKLENARDVTLSPFTEVFDRYVGRVMAKAKAGLVRRLQPVIVLLQKVNAGQLLIELIEEGLENTFNYVMDCGEITFALLREPLTELLHVDESTVILNIPLEIDVSQLKPIPSLEDIKIWLARSALATTINNGIERLYSYADDYYKVRALVYIPRDEILPPFKGHALVSGFRHFSTFDKKYYNFESGCATSHVLASDMRQNNFTVAISYDPSNRRNSIEVIVKNRHIIIYDNYQVKLNNRVKDLPIVQNEVSVLLEGTTIHVRRTEGDLDVACDFSKKLCSIDVSPYYFGATAGMAGVYNNEPMDDFSAPSHEIMRSPAALASAWESSETECDSANVYESCSETARHCVRLFNESDSPLRACFPLVDPEPFLAMCRDDTCNDGEAYCAAVHAYEYRCSLVGAKVEKPGECIKCQTTNTNRGEEIRNSMSQNTEISSLDMVFVVEQGSCMSGRHGVARNIKKFLKKLKATLREENVRNVNYRLVGYGGPGASASPSTITIRSKSYTTSAKKLQKALSKVTLSDSSNHTDALSAISYASQLPFRAGAKPMIVVLPCQMCRQSEISFSNVEWQLRNQGVLLHYLPPKQILEKKGKSIYGFDNQFAYSKGNTPASSSVLKPNKRDLCEPLATTTGGSVWNQRKLNNNDFLVKFTNYLMRKSEFGSRVTCRCDVNEIGVPTSKCTPLNRS